MEYMARSEPEITNFELAVDSLIDTNYRTLLSKYLMPMYIEDIIDGKRPSVPSGSNAEWRNLLKDLDLIDNIQDSKTKNSLSTLASPVPSPIK